METKTVPSPKVIFLEERNGIVLSKGEAGQAIIAPVMGKLTLTPTPLMALENGENRAFSL